MTTDQDGTIIRKYRPEDRRILKEITVRSFGPVSIARNIERIFGLTNGKDWAYRKKREIDAECDANPGGVLVAEAYGAVIGYITTLIERDTLIGRIPNLAIEEEFRGRGLGKKLIQAALDYLRAEGMRHAKIETLAQNDVGQRLYPQFGFKEVARQIHFVTEL